MDNRLARFLKWTAVLVFAAFSMVAFSAPCDPEENSWVPSRYYPPGSAVFHKGQWYESRQLHEGKTPGTAFEWKKLELGPDCRKRENKPLTENERKAEPQKPQARGLEQKKPAGKAQDKARQACEKTGRWSFGASYTVGQMAIHEGQAYRAIRPSNGQMPGMSQPPHWEPVDAPCTNRSDKGS